jgi:hypothetical protein
LTTPRTREQLEQAVAETEAWLDSLELDDTPLHDSSDFRRISEAMSAELAAEKELHDAVAAARTAGRSWAEVGLVLGVTRQTAQQRFGRPVPAG